MNDLAFHMIFSPQNCTLETLEATLTPKRRKLADDLVDRLEDACRKGLASHHLIVGPRGSGKTHVLSVVRRRLERLCQGDAPMVVIALSEEERSITRLLDFLVACIRALDVPVTGAMARIRAVPPEAAAEEALAILREQVVGKSTLVVVENFDALLGRMEEEAIGRLRAFFQNEPRLSLLASATSLFEDSDRADHPFYGFFLIEPLRPLDRQDCREFLRLLAAAADNRELAAAMGRRHAQARVNAIYDLTGGNHRLLAMLGPFLTADGLHDLVGPFVQMVDRELTPYYQQRLDRLSGQQNTVLRAIVDLSTMEGHLGRAVGLGEISEYTLWTSQQCSRLLFDLKYASLVRSIKRGRESFYELNEPLLRLVMDMKEGRNRPLPLIVNILRLWYEAEELQQLTQRAPACVRDYYVEAQRVKFETGAPEVPAAEIATAQEQGVRKDCAYPSGSDTADDISLSGSPETWRLIEDGAEVGRAGRHEAALALFEKALVQKEGVSEEQIVLALSNKALALNMLDRSEEAIQVYDDVVARFGGRDEIALLEQVARALFNKGITLGTLDRSEEEIQVYDDVVARLGGRDEIALLEPVAKALVYKGFRLGTLDRSEEAIQVYDDVVARFGGRDEIALLEQVARALVNKGFTLGTLDRSEEAIQVYDHVVARFGGRDEIALLEQVARALVNKGFTLGTLDRSEEAIQVYDHVVARFGGRDEVALLEQVARALIGKGIALGKVGRDRESLDSFRVAFDKAAHVSQLKAVSARAMISAFCRKEPMLKEAIAMLKQDEDDLANGLVQWVRRLLPMSKADAEGLKTCEAVLRESLADVPKCQPALQMLEAIRHDALGDNRALLELPLELRRLVSQGVG